MSPESANSGSSRDMGGVAVHKPVLLREVLRYLDLQPGLIVVDGTLGAGGHGREIIRAIGGGVGSDGTLIGLDRDPMMINLASRTLNDTACRLQQAGYEELPAVLEKLGIERVDRILLDLGLSSDQLADQSRGFSFDSPGPLDLRFDPTQGEPSWRMLERLEEAELAEIFQHYGEERFSRRIAGRIVQRRQSRPIRTAADLVEAVEEAVPKRYQRTSRKHPATRIFQALRIAVNDELDRLRSALDEGLFRSLAAGGRLVVISFHSLEDRIVKTAFRDKSRWENLTPRPVTPTQTEQRINPRCRTAKLRCAKKV